MPHPMVERIHRQAAPHQHLLIDRSLADGSPVGSDGCRRGERALHEVVELRFNRRPQARDRGVAHLLCDRRQRFGKHQRFVEHVQDDLVRAEDVVPLKQHAQPVPQLLQLQADHPESGHAEVPEVFHGEQWMVQRVRDAVDDRVHHRGDLLAGLDADANDDCGFGFHRVDQVAETPVNERRRKRTGRERRLAVHGHAGRHIELPRRRDCRRNPAGALTRATGHVTGHGGLVQTVEAGCRRHAGQREAECLLEGAHHRRRGVRVGAVGKERRLHAGLVGLLCRVQQIVGSHRLEERLRAAARMERNAIGRGHEGGPERQHGRAETRRGHVDDHFAFIVGEAGPGRTPIDEAGAPVDLEPHGVFAEDLHRRTCRRDVIGGLEQHDVDDVGPQVVDRRCGRQCEVGIAPGGRPRTAREVMESVVAGDPVDLQRDASKLQTQDSMQRLAGADSDGRAPQAGGTPVRDVHIAIGAERCQHDAPVPPDRRQCGHLRSGRDRLHRQRRA